MMSNQNRNSSIVLIESMLRKKSLNPGSRLLNQRKDSFDLSAAHSFQKTFAIIRRKKKERRRQKENIKSFNNNISTFENKLVNHRRNVTKLIMRQEKVKGSIYKKYRSMNESVIRKSPKKVNFSIRNFSLANSELGILNYKKARTKKLSKDVAIKEAKGPFQTYIEKMTNKHDYKKSERQGKEGESKENQQANKKDIFARTSIKERMVKFKERILKMKKNKSMVQIVLFQNLLTRFIKTNDVGKINEILQKEPALLSKTDEHNNLPIHNAIIYNKEASFKRLYPLSKNLRFFEIDVENPLKTAYSHKRIPMMKVSLAGNA